MRVRGVVAGCGWAGGRARDGLNGRLGSPPSARAPGASRTTLSPTTAGPGGVSVGVVELVGGAADLTHVVA